MKNLLKFKTLLFWLLTLTGFLPAQIIMAQENDSQQVKNSYLNVRIEIKTFQNTEQLSGWGYDIFIDDTHYINQPNIPAVPGNNGFISEEKARKTAEFIVEKIQKNIIPPSVNENELDSLGVLK